MLFVLAVTDKLLGRAVVGALLHNLYIPMVRTKFSLNERGLPGGLYRSETHLGMLLLRA
jgi:hypothetical protein